MGTRLSELYPGLPAESLLLFWGDRGMIHDNKSYSTSSLRFCVVVYQHIDEYSKQIMEFLLLIPIKCLSMHKKGICVSEKL